MSAASRNARAPVFTVSEITAYVKRLLDRDELLSEMSVRGEISNFTRHRSGHLYFSLKDDRSQLSCVCFRGDAARLTFEAEAGLRVVAHGNVTVYEPAGRYQLLVRAMQPDGAGELAEALAKLRARLQAEGLFDEARKRPLPAFPRRIVLVTSPTGAAVRDLVSVISRRFALAELLVLPTIVQGEAAPDSVVRSLRRVAALGDVDLAIVARGGGSLEDLWAFNDERVVRAIFACPVPVVSAVGHETDFTLADEAADVRAPTPSAAGEIAVPDARELLAQLGGYAERARIALARLTEGMAARLDALSDRPPLRRPVALLEAPWQRLDDAAERALRAAEIRLERLTSRTATATAALGALDPRRVLERGYAVCRRTRDGLTVRSVAQAPREEDLTVTVADGAFGARVTEAGTAGKDAEPHG